MNKWMLALLLLANAMFGAHLLGWVDLGLEDARDLKRSGTQLNPQAVTLLPKAPAAPKASEAPMPGSVTSPNTAGALCLQWQNLGVNEADAIQKWVAPMIAPQALVVQPREEFTSFLVYLPPAASQRDAQRRVAELNRIGVQETFVIPDGPLRWAISMGLFRSREGAQKLVTALQQRNISEVQIEPRNTTNVTTLRAEGLTQVQADQLLALKSRGAEWAPEACRPMPPSATTGN